MKQFSITPLSLICYILMGVIIGISLSSIIGKKSEISKIEIQKNQLVDTVSVSDILIKRGKVYVRDFVIDVNDPFGQKCTDTVTVLDLKSSPSKDNLVYVKWTFNKWNDTTKYISSEINYFTKGLRELK